jgi:hypothetical protein
VVESSKGEGKAMAVKEELEEQVVNLVPAAVGLAASSYTTVRDEFPEIDSVPVDSWDLCVTTASVFVGLAHLSELGLPERRRRALSESVVAEFEKREPRAWTALENCRDLVQRNYSALEGVEETAEADSIGWWIVWNLFERQPEGERELKLVRALGGLVTMSFRDWWPEKPAGLEEDQAVGRESPMYRLGKWWAKRFR